MATGNGEGDREERLKSSGGGGKDSAGLLYPGDSALATRLLAGVKAGKGESWARCECHDYTQVSEGVWCGVAGCDVM